MVKSRKRLLVGCVVAALVLVPLMAGAFAGGGILFGLATAPNGNVLVADATVGILILRNDVVNGTISLPGVTDMSPIGSGSMWAVTGAGDNPEADTGQALWRVSNGRAELIVNLFEFEAAENPVPPADVPDSNPFDVESLGGGAALVADAGGNDLLRISRHGDVEVLATFPVEGGAQPVPTSVAIGPDGYYVGELKGFVFPTGPPIGKSNIWRVSPGASETACPGADCVKVFDGGFTSIIDMVFGPDGNLYVAEMDEAGWLAAETPGGADGGTINSCDLDTLTCTVVASGIPQLTAITFDKDGNLWATRNSIVFGEAEVFQATP